MGEGGNCAELAAVTSKPMRRRFWLPAVKMNFPIVIKQKQTIEESRYKRYELSAKKRGIAFGMSFDQFMFYWNKPCYYCNSQVLYVGIDRLDSSVGYVEGNMVPCCNWCNMAKRTASVTEFVDHCRAVIEWHDMNKTPIIYE